MNNKDQRKLQSFRRVQGWAVAHRDILQAAPPPVMTHVQTLEGVVSRLESNAVTQVTQHQLSTLDATDAHQLRAEVRDAMRPITQVARGLRGTVFGISAISTMPDSKADSEKLVIAATSMADSAAIFKTTLIDHGLQPDLIETVQNAAAALKSSIDARGQAKSAGVGATKGIHPDIVAGRNIVSFIDAGLAPQLRKDPVLLASWKNAKRATTKGVVGVITPLVPTPAVATPSTTPSAATASVPVVPPVSAIHAA